MNFLNEGKAESSKMSKLPIADNNNVPEVSFVPFYEIEDTFTIFAMFL